MGASAEIPTFGSMNGGLVREAIVNHTSRRITFY